MERNKGEVYLVSEAITAGRTLQRSVRRHALGWLVAANAVGFWLAALLLWPELNELTAPFTYGRWVPLHLDWQLYGWCALPLVGALYRFYFNASSAETWFGRVGLWAWTFALMYAGLTWLAGGASGKLFINFADSARVGWTLALLVLWLVIAGFWLRVERGFRTRLAQLMGDVLLVLLLTVPFLFYWAAGLTVYPVVDPDSGGATGASLFGSTLALVALFGLLPHLLRLKKIGNDRYYWPAFILSVTFFAGMQHSNASHHNLGQIAGMAVLLAWIPAMAVFARTYRWAENSRRWLTAAFVWWLSLVVTGFLTFLPGWSERLKFTNALVAHSHLAMAGLVTSLHVAILLNLDFGAGKLAGVAAKVETPASLPARRREEFTLSDWSFWLWQTSCALHVTVLLWLGWNEGGDPSLLYVRGGLADWCYGLRFAAGGAMFVASLNWLWAAWKNDQE